MTLSSLPLDAREAPLDLQQTDLYQAPPEVQDDGELTGSTLAQEVKQSHADVSPEPHGRIESSSCRNRDATKCSQACDSVYYHKVTPKVAVRAKPMLQDGCIFSYFKPRPLELPSMMTNTIPAASKIGAETVEEKKVEDNTGKSSLANFSPPETVASDFALMEENEVLEEPAAVSKSKTTVLPAEPDHHGMRWKKGVQLPTSDPNSEANLRVSTNLAYNLFIPGLEGNKFTHISPFMTPEVKTSKFGEEIQAEKAPAKGLMQESSPNTLPSPADQSTLRQSDTPDDKASTQDNKLQDRAAVAVGVPLRIKVASNEPEDWPTAENLKPGPFSPTISAGTAFGNISWETAKSLAPLGAVPNLTKPDLSWVPNSPVTFTSSASTTSKGNATPPRLARLRGGITKKASEVIKVAEPAFDFGKSAFKIDFSSASYGLSGRKSSSSSSSSQNSIRDSFAGSRGESPQKTELVNQYPKSLPEPEMPLQYHGQQRPPHHAGTSPEEERVAEVRQLRARAEVAFLKKQIKRAYWITRVREIQEKTAPKAEKEEKDVHTVVAASKTSDRKTQRQAAKAQHETVMGSSAVTQVEVMSTSKAEVAPALVLNGHYQSRQMGNLTDDEFRVQSGPTNRRKRAHAFKQSQMKKEEHLAARSELMKTEEERRLADKAAPPVLSAAAKRRSRAKRNAGRQSWADVART